MLFDCSASLPEMVALQAGWEQPEASLVMFEAGRAMSTLNAHHSDTKSNRCGRGVACVYGSLRNLSFW